MAVLLKRASLKDGTSSLLTEEGISPLLSFQEYPCLPDEPYHTALFSFFRETGMNPATSLTSLGGFRSDPKRFAVEIDNNRFSTDRVVLNMEDDNQKIVGEIRLIDPFLWPRRFYSPGIMGPFSFVPFMECYHGVVSMDHSLVGEVEVPFDEGPRGSELSSN